MGRDSLCPADGLARMCRRFQLRWIGARVGTSRWRPLTQPPIVVLGGWILDSATWHLQTIELWDPLKVFLLDLEILLFAGRADDGDEEFLVVFRPAQLAEIGEREF